MNMVAKRVQRIKPSPTLEITNKANQLKSKGHDIINLSAGEPDFDTPDFIKQAAIQAIYSGFTKYTPVDGIPSLKTAVISKFKRDNNLNYNNQQILVSCGCKQSFYNLVQALLCKGDEVIIPSPYWVSYPDMVLLADGIPVILESNIENNFKISPNDLENAITPRTRLFVINSPSNPTGITYSNNELVAIGEVLRKYPDIYIVTDDIYEHIQWSNNKSYNIVNVCPYLYDRTIVINGVSKAYAMTGWRIGYCGGPQYLVKAMHTIQSQSTSNPNSIAQIAAEAGLNGDQTCVIEMCKIFKDRHDYVYDNLSKLPYTKVIPSDGTFYIFPDFGNIISKLGFKSDVEFAEKLLIKYGVALVPGSAFGAPGYMRVSFANNMKNLEIGMERIARSFND